MKKTMELRITIYGIFDLSGWCHYVGQTMDLTARNRQHFDAGKARFKATQFFIKKIREVRERDANRVEAQIGIAYQRRGQAEFSKRFTPRAKRADRGGQLIYVSSCPLPFCSPAAAASFLGCSPQTIKNNLHGTVLSGDEEVCISDKPIELNWQI